MATMRTWYTCNDLDLSALDTSTIAKRNASCFWALKAALLQQYLGPNLGPAGAPAAGAAWTCVGSSDGVTAGLDGVDRWGATFNTSKLVIANGGTAHSWILLRSPSTGWAGGPVYLMLSCSVISTNGLAGFVSKDAWTGGTVTTDPSCTNARANNPSDAYLQLGNPATGACRFHFTTDQYGHFIALVSTNGTTSSAYSVIGIAEVTDRKSNDGDGWTYFNYGGLLTPFVGPLLWNQFSSSWHTMTFCWLFGRATGVQLARTTVNSQGETDRVPLYVGYLDNYGTGTSGGVGLERGLKGSFVDCFMGFALPCLTSTPAAGNMEAMSMGDGIWFPFTRVPTF